MSPIFGQKAPTSGFVKKHRRPQEDEGKQQVNGMSPDPADPAAAADAQKTQKKRDEEMSEFVARLDTLVSIPHWFD